MKVETIKKEVRWRIQASRPNTENWVDREDFCYSGWFYSFGNETPNQTILNDLNEAVKSQPNLNWRLVQDERSFTSTVAKEIRVD